MCVRVFAVSEHIGATWYDARLSRREKEWQTVGLYVSERRTKNTSECILI